MSMSIRTLIDGLTSDGKHLIVREDMDAGLPYERRFTVTLDGEPVEIAHATRLRDGGTTRIQTALGLIVWPAPRRRERGQSVTFAGQPLIA